MKAKPEYDCIIIGAGAAGAATAYQLSKRGKSVLLLEQFALGHDRGSSHGHSRVFRFAYDILAYAQMAIRALESWRELEAESGTRLLTITGGLDLGPMDSSTLEHTRTVMIATDNPFDTLEASELIKRFPQWRIPDEWIALHSPNAGILNPSHCVEVATAMARLHGATILEHTTVQKIQAEASGVGAQVQTDNGSFTAKKVVVTAGAWLPKLFPELALPIKVSLEAGVFFRPAKLEAFMPERFPVFVAHNPNTTSSERFDHALHYGFPVYELPGVKLGLHQAGSFVNADSRGYDVPDQTLRKLETWIAKHLPGAAGPVMHAKTCLYSNTPSEDFLIDSLDHFVKGGARDVILASPCSGHGFKFMPLLGEMIADLVEGRANPYQFERFQANRALLETTA